MARTGFELKELTSAHSYSVPFRIGGCSAAACTGPVLLGAILLLGIMLECSYQNVSTAEQELLGCLSAYSLLGSLLVSSFFSLCIPRFLSDTRIDAALPAFFGINAIALPIGGAAAAWFLMLCGVPFGLGIFAWCFFMELNVLWSIQGFLAAAKEYRWLLISDLLGIAASLMLAAPALSGSADPVLGAFISLCAGCGLMVVIGFVTLFRRFPDSSTDPFLFLRWLKQNLLPGLAGVLMTVGLSVPMLVIWFTPRCGIPALMAAMTVFITAVCFDRSMEGSFYPKFREYTALFHDRGTIRDLLRMEKELQRLLKQELGYAALKQLLCTAACISLGELLLPRLPLIFDALMLGFFRTMSIGFGIYAAAIPFLVLQLCFTDDIGVFRSAAVFSGSATLFTLISLLFPENFYGISFLLSCVLFFLYSLLRLDACIRRLPRYVLSAQPIITESRTGYFSRLHSFPKSRTGLKGRKQNAAEKE